MAVDAEELVSRLPSNHLKSMNCKQTSRTHQIQLEENGSVYICFRLNEEQKADFENLKWMVKVR